jgi:hypothetical protein
MIIPDILHYLYIAQCDTSTLLGWIEQLVLDFLNWNRLQHLPDGNFIAPNFKKGPLFSNWWPIRIIWHYRNPDGSISSNPTTILTYDFYIIPLLQIPIGGLRKDYLTIQNDGNVVGIGSVLFGLFTFNYSLTKQ